MNFKKLFIFEMANNHMGDVEHAKAIIDEFKFFIDKHKEFQFAIKFQMRDIPTFIHKDYYDKDEIKYVKRFKDTFLGKEKMLELNNYAHEAGFITVCTGFDEKSVVYMNDIDFDIFKMASCSSND